MITSKTNPDLGSDQQRFVLTASLIAIFICYSFIFLSYFSFYILQDFPNSGDEYALLFQAKTFLKGRLWNPVPNGREFFDLFHVLQYDGKWVGKYPPGWPLILALGMALKIPSGFINPMLATLSLVILFLIGEMLFDRRVAAIAIVACLLSPFFIFHSASYYSHTSCTLAILLAFYFGIRLNKNSGNAKDAYLVGLFLGLASIIRLYSTIVCVPPLLWYLWTHRREARIRDMRRIFIGFSPFLLISLWYNYQVTGNMLLTPFRLYDASDTIQISWYAIRQAYHFLVMQWRWMNPTVLVLYFVFIFHDLIKRIPVSLYAVFGLLVLSSVFYDMYGDHYGARYYFEGYPLCVLFVCGKIFSGEGFVRPTLFKKVLIGCFGVGFLLNFLCLFPLAHVYHQRIGNRKAVYALAEKNGLAHAVVFVDEEGGYSHSWFARNGVELDGKVIFARSFGARNKVLKRYFPDRKFFLYNPSAKETTAAFSELNY